MTKFEVAIQQNKVFVRSKDKKEDCIALSDNNYELLVEKGDCLNEGFECAFECEGILGCYKLSRSIFIAFIKDVDTIGMGLLGKPVYQIKNVDFVKLPLVGDNPVNDSYISMIQTVLAVTNIYYSHDEDLTKRVQDTLAKPLSEENRQFPTTMDTEFMFNYPIIQDFIPFKNLILKDLIPITIFGYMKIVPFATIEKTSFSLTLISRRSIHRNGRRFNTRGVDEEGNVANFVETEQIIHTRDGQLFSFVQIRGSIPLEWTQKPYLKYTPKIHIAGNRGLLGVHFDRLISKYGNIIVVNLIDKKKDQLMIGEEYERGCMQYNQYKNAVNFTWFDFHKECKGMHFENVKKLTASTEESVKNAGYFSMNIQSNQVLLKQTAVIRTNCIDCLDRTNVVQSEYAKEMLFNQLFKEKGKEIMNECFSQMNDFVSIFNNMWSDNADQMSLFYSSSNSLKTDYTRTGKRTKMGAVMDGVNSVIRYFNNNFYDGYFEDCLNLTFNEVEMGSKTDHIVKKRSRYTITQFLLFVFIPAIVIFGLIASFSSNEKQSFWFMFLLYVALVFYLFVKKGVSFGRVFVSKALLPTKQKKTN